MLRAGPPVPRFVDRVGLLTCSVGGTEGGGMTEQQHPARGRSGAGGGAHGATSAAAFVGVMRTS